VQNNHRVDLLRSASSRNVDWPAVGSWRYCANDAFGSSQGHGDAFDGSANPALPRLNRSRHCFFTTAKIGGTARAAPTCFVPDYLPINPITKSGHPFFIGVADSFTYEF
jgi:hypothetical protein